VPLFFTKTVQLVAGLALAALCASADTFSQVYVSLGPVPGVSGTYANYTINAQSGAVSGSNAGNINTSPAGFTQQTSITNAQFTFDTDFHNWMGSASPTGAFANEYGTVLFFSVVLTGVGNDLNLNNISYTESDTDSLIPDYFGYSGSFAGSAYGADAVGILANGTTESSGTAGTTMVHQIILTGVGVGFDATGQYSGTPDQQLAAAIADENTLGNYAITTCFADSADGLSTCGSVNVSASAVPEPGCLALAGLGLASLLVVAGRGKFSPEKAD
jgi:hypothetical protein